MFRPQPMQKVKVIALDKHRQDLVKKLHELGSVQVKDIREKVERPEWKKFLQSAELPTESRELAPLIIKIDRILDIFNSIEGKKSSFLGLEEKVEPEKVQEKDTEKLKDECRQMLEKLDKPVISANSKLDNVKTKITSVRKLKEAYEILDLFDIKPKHLKNTEKTCSFLGFIENEVVEDFSKRIEEEVDNFVLQKEKLGKEKTAVLLISFKENESELTLALRHFGFEELEIPEIDVKKEKIGAKIKELKEKKEEIKENLEELSKKWRKKLSVLREQVEIKKDRADIVGSMGSTKRTFILEGWVPKNKSEKIEKKIKKVCNKCAYVKFEESDDSEEIHVKLKNPKLLKPFELLTNMYSTPSYGELDPTPILAITLVLFAGLMLTDFVYGALFLAFGAYLWKKAARHQEGVINLGKVVVALGLSTMFFGILTGGYLGDLPKYLFGISSQQLAFWVDPLTNPLALLSFALIIGLAHLNIGLIVGIYNNILERKYLDIISDQIIWFLLQVAAFVLVGGMLGIAEFSMTTQYIAYGLTGISLAILLKTNGMIGMFDVTGFLGDFISYSRLLALALATGGIAMTFNLLAGMVWGIPYVGFIFGILIFFIGHIFSFALNSLGAFIHGIRLHYVEFFSKFYEGGGNDFEPFKLERRYTRK